MGNLITLQTRWYSTRSEWVRICCSCAAFCALAPLLLCAVVWPEQADAQARASYPYTLTNGTVADANQVMTNFNAINNAINACAAPLYNPVFTGDITLNNSNNSAITFRDGDLTPRTHSFFVTNTDANGGMLAGITNYPGSGTDVNLNGLYITPSYAGNWDQWVPTISVIGQSANGAGFVGIGTATPGYALQVNGIVAATGFMDISDARVKKDVVAIKDSLSIIEQLQGVRFSFRNPAERDVGQSLALPLNQRQIGFVAQDVRAVLPEAVTIAAGPDALMSIQESKIVPVLVEALKELKAANDSEAKEIEALKADIAQIKREKGFHTATN